MQSVKTFAYFKLHLKQTNKQKMLRFIFDALFQPNSIVRNENYLIAIDVVNSISKYLQNA